MNILKTFLTGVILLGISLISIAQTATDLTSAVAEMERIYKNTYDIEKGITTCKEVLSLAEKGTVAYFDALFYLGEWYIAKREKKEMISLLKEMKTALDANTAPSLANYTINWLYLKSEYNLHLTHNYEKAAFYSLKILLKARKNPQLMGRFTWQTAKCFGFLSQNEAGAQVLKIYQLVEKSYLQTDFDKCKYYLKIGIAQLELDAEEQAKKNLTKAVDIAASFKEEAPKLYDYCRYQLALYHRYFGDNEELMNLLNSIVEGGNRDYKYVGLLGRRLSSNNKHDEALKYIQEALDKMSEEVDMDNYDTDFTKYTEIADPEFASHLVYYKSWALRLKALEYIEQGDKEKGIELLRKAVTTGEIGIHGANQFIDEMIGYKIGVLVSKEGLHLIMGGIIYALETLYQVTKDEEDLEQLFHYIEQRKCVDIHHALSADLLPEPYATQLTQYERKIESYELRYMKNPKGFTVGLIDSMLMVMEELEVFKEEIFKITDKVRTTNEDIDFLTLKEIQHSLDEHTAFIQYCKIRSRVYGIFITNKETQVELLGISDDYESYIESYIELCESPLLVQDVHRNTFIQKSNELYKLLLAPFEQKLQGKSKLIISPERKILSIPFETLLKENTIKPLHELDYLIHHFEINYQYSATLHQKIQQRPAIKDYSALTFAPVFSTEKSMGNAERSLNIFRGQEYGGILEEDEFVPLPNTLTEVKSIKNVLAPFGKVTALTERKATKKQLIKALSNNAYQFVHLASHSVVNLQDPRLSMIACYQHDEKDNLYFSNDITNLSIQADLVILSSCESGIGRIINGEGLIGLNRSFIIAGARNVLFTLWKVNDKYSSNLMIDFYKNYTQTQDYTKALHQAKLKMLANPQTASPRYWAPFVLMGE